jgi:hypothetical protein
MDEEIKTQRKQWQKPELVVLTRSKPEEAVLTVCKAGSILGPRTSFTSWCVESGCPNCLDRPAS